jgi:hypothetical protein
MLMLMLMMVLLVSTKWLGKSYFGMHSAVVVLAGNARALSHNTSLATRPSSLCASVDYRLVVCIVVCWNSCCGDFEPVWLPKFLIALHEFRCHSCVVIRCPNKSSWYLTYTYTNSLSRSLCLSQ